MLPKEKWLSCLRRYTEQKKFTTSKTLRRVSQSETSPRSTITPEPIANSRTDSHQQLITTMDTLLDLPWDILLRIISHVSTHDIVALLKAFPPLQSQAVLVTISNKDNPRFFTHLPHVIRKYAVACDGQPMPVDSVDDLYDTNVHRQRIKLVEVPYFPYAEEEESSGVLLTELCFDCEKRGFRHSFEILGVDFHNPVINFDSTTFVFLDESMPATATDTEYEYCLEERLSELTTCHYHCGVPLSIERPAGQHHYTTLRELKLDSTAAIEGLTLPLLQSLSIVSAHQKARLEIKNVTLPALDRLVIRFDGDVPKIQEFNVPRDPSSASFTMFEMTKTDTTRTDLDHLQDLDLSFVGSFKFVRFTNVPTRIFAYADFTSTEILRITLQQPQTDASKYRLRGLISLNLQIGSSNVTLPTFDTPRLEKLVMGIHAPRADLSFFGKSHMTPGTVFVFRNLRLLDSPNTAHFTLDTRAWTKILSQTVKLIMSGFDMPFMFDKSHTDIDGEGSLWIWHQAPTMSMTLRPVLGHTDGLYDYDANFLTTGHANLCIPHRKLTSWDYSIPLFRTRTTLTLIPVVLNDPDAHNVVKTVLSISILDCDFPYSLNLVTGVYFDDFVLNGDKLPSEDKWAIVKSISQSLCPRAQRLPDPEAAYLARYNIDPYLAHPYDLAHWCMLGIGPEYRLEYREQCFTRQQLQAAQARECGLSPFRWTAKIGNRSLAAYVSCPHITNANLRELMGNGTAPSSLHRSNKRRLIYPSDWVDPSKWR